MTNYEYLRGLPLDELAKELINLPFCSICKFNGGYECSGSICLSVAREWLKSERKENDK